MEESESNVEKDGLIISLLKLEKTHGHPKKTKSLSIFIQEYVIFIDFDINHIYNDIAW